MKKILLATTMLAGTAGFAAAEITLSGSAEMGIYSSTSGDIELWQDVDVSFEMTGTTDGGLEFGTKVDLDEAGNLGTTTDDQGVAIWISGAFGKLTMGDTDGALDWALADMDGGLGSMADDHTAHVAWFGGDDLVNGDDQRVRYENTFGAVSFAISAEQGDDGVGVVDDIFGVGVKYTADLGGTAVDLGLGYLDAGSAGAAVGISAGAKLAGGFGGKIGYISYDNYVLGLDSHIGLEVTYASGPIGVSVNYGKLEDTFGNTLDSWGLAANYDLGGGAKVLFGYGSDMNGLQDDQWSLGLGMSF